MILTLMDIIGDNDAIAVGNNIYARTDAFISKFGHVTPLTYDNLMAVDKGEAGYQSLFEKWKEKGLIE